MASSTNRRGRPKGSGIDDRAVLRRIDDMLDADPDLKPTTAIKAMGVTDPSTIRRLRDKLKVGEFRVPRPTLPSGCGVPVQLPLFEARSSATPSPASAGRRDFHGGLAEVSGSISSDASTQWLLSLYALGLSAFSTTVETQMSLLDDFLHVPQVESVLRHQLLVNEAVAKALCPMRSDVRTTLH